MGGIILVVGGVYLAHGPDVVLVDNGHVIKAAAASLSAELPGLPGKIVGGGVRGGQAYCGAFG